MPRDIPTHTVCAAPGVARSSKQLGGLAGTLVNAFFANGTVTVGAFLAYLVALVLLQIPALWVATVTALTVALVEFKNWYYYGRLLCIRDRDCAIGTVISEPTASFDGDRKLNILLAPHSQGQVVNTLLRHLKRAEPMLNNDANFNNPPFHPPRPELPPDRGDNFDKLRDYMKALQSEDPDDEDGDSEMFNQTLIGVVHRLMIDPAKNFYNRYYRKDAAHIAPGSALSNAIPTDFDNATDWLGPNPQGGTPVFNDYSKRTERLNPMFRWESSHLLPYLHCEIDGYYIALLIDNIIMALWAWLALILALAPLGPLGPVVALAIAALLFFLKSLFDEITGNDGDADAPDVDWDDPEVPGDDEGQREGDVVVTYGNYIMDTEHSNFFEIHPVRAYYLVARNNRGKEPILLNDNLEQEEYGFENFDQRKITRQRADEICGIITQAEEDVPPPVITRTAPTVLSYGLTTRYAGGGANAPAIT